MKKARWRVGHLAAVATLVIAVAACGEDETDEGAGSEAATTTEDRSPETTTSVSADDGRGEDDGDDHDSDTSVDDDHDHDDHDDHDHHDHDDHDHDEAADAGGSERVEHDVAQVRLFVADGEGARAAIIDFETGETVSSVEVDDVATQGTATSEDGRYVYVAHAESVTVVDGGTWTVPHGAHAHYYTAEPVVLGVVDGVRPTHVVSHDGVAALWFDGSGTAALVDEDGLAAGSVDVFATIETEMPHHGFAVPFHGHYVTTSQEVETESGMPGVVGVRTVDGDLVATFDCADTHGEGALADAAFAACDDGVLVVTGDGGSWTGEVATYPQVDDEDPFGYGDARAWGLAINPDVDRVGAPFGARHVLWLDPATGDADAFEVAGDGSDTAVAQFGVAIHGDGDLVAVLTTDGFVRTVDTSDGTIVDEAEVMQPWVEDFETEYWPQVLIVDDSVLAVDPYGAQIVELDIRDLTIIDTIEPGFTPSIVQVLGA